MDEPRPLDALIKSSRQSHAVAIVHARCNSRRYRISPFGGFVFTECWADGSSMLHRPSGECPNCGLRTSGRICSLLLVTLVEKIAPVALHLPAVPTAQLIANRIDLDTRLVYATVRRDHHRGSAVELQIDDQDERPCSPDQAVLRKHQDILEAALWRHFKGKVHQDDYPSCWATLRQIWESHTIEAPPRAPR